MRALVVAVVLLASRATPSSRGRPRASSRRRRSSRTRSTRRRSRAPRAARRGEVVALHDGQVTKEPPRSPAAAP